MPNSKDSDSASASLLASIQTRFHCMTDGTIRDSNGQGWVVWNLVDFHRWWHAFETNAAVPLGRKLMHAAADQEEYSLNRSALLETGWLMRKKRLNSSLAIRWSEMGWGKYDFGSSTVLSNLLAPVCSGFALAAVEGITGERKKIQWHQVSNVMIQLEMEMDSRSISLAPSPPQFVWDSDSTLPSFIDGKAVQLDLHSVEHGWTNSGESTCFLPSGIFQRLFQYVKLQGLVLSPEVLAAWELPEETSSSDWIPLIINSLAVNEMISQSELPIYIQDLESWNQLNDAYLVPNGLGTFSHLTALDEQGGVEFELCSTSVFPFTVAYLIAYWQRGIGRKAKVKLEQKNGKWILQLTSLRSYSY
jgi:hypothetical protein